MDVTGNVYQDDLGRHYRIVECDDTCYHDNHSPDNPWVWAECLHDGSKRIGCLKTLFPETWKVPIYVGISD